MFSDEERAARHAEAQIRYKERKKKSGHILRSLWVPAGRDGEYLSAVAELQARWEKATRFNAKDADESQGVLDLSSPGAEGV